MKTLPEGKFILREKGLTVLQLEGNCSEMGLQHGAFLREEIHLVRSKFIDYLSRGKWSVFGRLLYWLLMVFAKTMNRYIPDALRKEMLSASKGANVPYYFILLLNVLDDLLNLLFCSSFAITEDGHTICGRNLNYDIFTDLMAHLNTVFVYKPKEGYPLTSAPRSIGNNVLLASDNEAFVLNSQPQHLPYLLTDLGESGKGRFFSSPPHTTPHAGPHGAVPGKF